ncbi:hypothetical protein IJ818_04145 [bacterium]|nr:hypothetical protein [bacterium]
MEMKAELLKPYSENDRLNFIVENNHKHGCVIKETDLALQAFGYSDDEIKEQKIQQFKKDFFETTLGYIRRKVTMANGDTKDFLSDLLPTIAMGVNMGQEVKIIAYDMPDFADLKSIEEYQHSELVTAQFVQECFVQLSNDFNLK